MKNNILLGPLLLLLSFPILASSNPFIGHWQTIDDNSGEPRSIVEITKEGDELKGTIVKLLNPTEPNPKCDKCSGDKKNQPITGLEIIWGLEQSRPNEEYSGGNILDPENGRTYSCRLRIKEGGEKLEVRGFMGFSLLGRSQTWTKVDSPQAEDI